MSLDFLGGRMQLGDFRMRTMLCFGNLFFCFEIRTPMLNEAFVEGECPINFKFIVLCLFVLFVFFNPS